MARPAKPQTIRTTLLAARSRLDAARVPNGWLDAEVLLAHLLGADRAWLHAHPEQPLGAAQRRRMGRLIGRRAARVPVPYLVGRKEFYGYALRVSPAALIPRPETELLVDLAIEWLRGQPAARRMIDVGTGSGAIAIAVAKRVRSVRILATDIDRRALALAAANVREQRVASRVELRRAHLLAGLPPADLIVANLPYVTTAQRRAAQAELDYEPEWALTAGADGLDVIREAIHQAPAVLRRGGAMLLECDPAQVGRIGRLASKALPSATITVHPDLAGRNRAVVIEQP